MSGEARCDRSASGTALGLIDCGLERIISIAQVGNDASEHIAGKLGMQLERETAPRCSRYPWLRRRYGPGH